jgi:hypothetical protein
MLMHRCHQYFPAAVLLYLRLKRAVPVDFDLSAEGQTTPGNPASLEICNM